LKQIEFNEIYPNQDENASTKWFPMTIPSSIYDFLKKFLGLLVQFEDLRSWVREEGEEEERNKTRILKYSI